jgi:hypothetical protein
MKPNESEQSLQEWRRRISEHSKSGLTQAEYCRRNGLSDKALYYWMRKIRQVETTGKKSDVFVELRPKRSETDSASRICRICFPGDIVVEVPFGSDVGWLGELIAGFTSK